MAEFLDLMRHAATETLKLIWDERKQLEGLAAFIHAREGEIAEANRRVEFLAMNPDLDDEGIGTATYWETYFGPEKERYYAEKSREELEALIEVRRFSTNAQAGNLLQYAKQGISTVHQGKSACADGRPVLGGVSLRDVAWEGRNQAQHWEEGKPNKGVQECFDALAAVDSRFGPYRTENLAFEIVNLLGWREFPDFERDMLKLVRK